MADKGSEEHKSYEEIITGYWRKKEKEVCDEYSKVLNEVTDKLDQLDKETNYYPIIELTEDGTVGRFGSECFSRGWSITPRRWNELSKEKLEAKVKEYSELVEKYSNQIVQLQQLLARQK